MIDRFFGGDIANYRSKDPTKTTSFAALSRSCAEDLANLGLRPRVLRQCINARATYDALPPHLRDTLLFTQVVELARVDDASQRARLAMDATAQQWSVDQLKDAVRKANDGGYYDTDTAAPGTQLPAEQPQAAIGRKPGRVLKQFEQAVNDLAALRSDWLGADAQALKPAHKRRAKAVLAGLKAEVAALEQALAAASYTR